MAKTTNGETGNGGTGRKALRAWRITIHALLVADTDPACGDGAELLAQIEQDATWHCESVELTE